jgi:hypothetical protein
MTQRSPWTRVFWRPLGWVARSGRSPDWLKMKNANAPPLICCADEF